MADTKLTTRVSETTSTTGTGTLDLNGAQTGYRGFSDELTSGDETWYLITDSATSPTFYEAGRGTFTTGSPNTLSRDTVVASSNSGNKVSLPVGTAIVSGSPSKEFIDRLSAITTQAVLLEDQSSDPSTPASTIARYSKSGVPFRRGPSDGTVVEETGLLRSVQVFTSSGTWNRPSGCVAVRVTVVAGGGGGSGAGSGGGGGGGGGGGTAIKYVSSPGASESVTVGAGGAAGSTTPTAGGAGGTSSFGAHCSATGGSGGQAISPGGGAGGIGSSGDTNIRGAGGSGITNTSAGSPGGSSAFGGGGGAQWNAASQSGGAYGGGGGGATGAGATARAGGAGAAGVVYVEEYY